MTDRQVGSEGLNVDLAVAVERRLAGGGIQIDFSPPSGPLAGNQLAGLGLNLDVVPTAQRRLGGGGLMVDYIPSTIPLNAVRWSNVAFEAGTSSPLVYWISPAFQVSGTKPVVWLTDHFGVAS